LAVSRWSLRTRLVAAAVGLSAIALTIAGFAGVTLSEVRHRAGKAFTVRATNGSAEFRVRAAPLSSGSGSVAVAVSLRSLDETVGRLRTITLVTAAVVLAALVAVAVL